MKIKTTIKDVITMIRKLPNPNKSMISKVLIIMELSLVSPATYASSKRSFSALKRFKTTFWSALSDLRLNSLMTLYINKGLLTSTFHVETIF